MPRLYEPLGPFLLDILAAAEKRLSKKPGRATIMPGNHVTWDDCCDGMLWVRIVSIVGSSALSRPAIQPCLPMYQIRCGIGVIRCAHTLDDQGVPPSSQEMAGDAMLTFQDRAELTQCLAVDVASMIEDRNDMQTFRIEDWLPSGPTGGCVGGETTFTFSHILCLPEETP